MRSQRAEDLLFPRFGFSVEFVKSVKSVVKVIERYSAKSRSGSPWAYLELTNSTNDSNSTKPAWTTVRVCHLVAPLNSSHPSNGSAKILDRYSAQAQLNSRSGRHEDLLNDGFDGCDGFYGYGNCIPRRDTAVHGGNTAQRVDARNCSNKEGRCFLSLLSGRCLEFFVRVKSVPIVKATSQLAFRPPGAGPRSSG
jgi:hypothetical protein